MGSTIHPSCTAGGPEESGGWESQQCVSVLVAVSVPERVSRVLQDATFVVVSCRPLNVIGFMLMYGWKILPCVSLYLIIVKAWPWRTRAASCFDTPDELGPWVELEPNEERAPNFSWQVHVTTGTHSADLLLSVSRVHSTALHGTVCIVTPSAYLCIMVCTCACCL